MNLARRESSRIAFIRMDNDSRYRKALLRRSKPSKGVYPLGAYVYFRREQVRKSRDSPDPIHRWFGPARVIGYEGVRGEGSGATIVYLRYQGSSVLAAPEQLRYAAEEELIVWDNLAPDLRDKDQHPGPHFVHDVRAPYQERRRRPVVQQIVVVPQGGGVPAERAPAVVVVPAVVHEVPDPATSTRSSAITFTRSTPTPS